MIITAGSDGFIEFRDTETRGLTRSIGPAPAPISSLALNHDGSLLAYAISYDWSKGHSAMTPGTPNTLMLHRNRAR
ncbi:hypothetical protein FA15DRAFT_665662 [Coprinopsis marcescibilis]|uniref:Anaphase-promoting complex subunit 4 WD40 domain-containing protein n=1 Tax=Coprinopsis marcescibilis TaxID=230819 RepID=A0A5C3L7Z1_COPMA|nr:hypothetical protein FA15DRAFT_665662 [Coprinopsis marcescibilis]